MKKILLLREQNSRSLFPNCSTACAKKQNHRMAAFVHLSCGIFHIEIGDVVKDTMIYGTKLGNCAKKTSRDTVQVPHDYIT